MRARTVKDIGLLIRDQRLKLGLDQRALAERAGVSRQWIVEVEKGKARAEVGLILRTLLALGLELDVRAASAKPTANARTSGKVSLDSRARVDLDDVIARARGNK